MILRTLLPCLFLTLCTGLCTGQSTWEQLSNHPSSGIERPFSFEIDGVVYVGAGRRNETTNVANVRAYDVATDTWTQKANFPGGGLRNAFSFQVGGKGYIGAGFNGSETIAEFWKYDPTDDSWTQLPDFPGGQRNHALAIAADSTAYVLLGGESTSIVYKKDMWEFNANTEMWTQLDNFPGSSRWRSFGFIIGEKLYAGGGARFPNQALRDFYVFDLVSGTWNENRRAVIPTRKSTSGFFFAIHGIGYYGEGSNGLDTGTGNLGTKLFAYDPVMDEWTEEADFIGPERMLGFSVVSGDKAILGLGRNYEIQDDYRDIYSFTPGTTSSVTFEAGTRLSVFPNPLSSSPLSIQGAFLEGKTVVINLYDIKGTALPLGGSRISRAGADMIQLNVEHLPPGIYHVEMIYGNDREVLRFVKE